MALAKSDTTNVHGQLVFFFSLSLSQKKGHSHPYPPPISVVLVPGLVIPVTVLNWILCPSLLKCEVCRSQSIHFGAVS